MDEIEAPQEVGAQRQKIAADEFVAAIMRLVDDVDFPTTGGIPPAGSRDRAAGAAIAVEQLQHGAHQVMRLTSK